jgi:hypothetical protein
MARWCPASIRASTPDVKKRPGGYVLFRYFLSGSLQLDETGDDAGYTAIQSRQRSNGEAPALLENPGRYLSTPNAGYDLRGFNG